MGNSTTFPHLMGQLYRSLGKNARAFSLARFSIFHLLQSAKYKIKRPLKSADAFQTRYSVKKTEKFLKVFPLFLIVELISTHYFKPLGRLGRSMVDRCTG